MTYYTTLTSKGQITLPAAIRHQLKLRGGQRVKVMFGSNNQVIVEAPPDILTVQARNRAHLKQQGFTPEKLIEMARNYKNGDGMAAAAQEKYGKP